MWAMWSCLGFRVKRFVHSSLVLLQTALFRDIYIGFGIARQLQVDTVLPVILLVSMKMPPIMEWQHPSHLDVGASYRCFGAKGTLAWHCASGTSNTIILMTVGVSVIQRRFSLWCVSTSPGCTSSISPIYLGIWASYMVLWCQRYFSTALCQWHIYQWN